MKVLGNFCMYISSLNERHITKYLSTDMAGKMVLFNTGKIQLFPTENSVP